LLCAIKAIARQAAPKLLGHSKEVSLFMEVEQRGVIKFFVREGMKEVEIIDKLNKRYGEDARQ
jgi:hypothetical protein